MKKELIGKRLLEIKSNILRKTATIYFNDIDRPDKSIDLICCFVFFPSVNVTNKGITNNTLIEISNTTDRLVTGSEYQQIERLAICLSKKYEKTDGPTRKILEDSYYEIMQLLIDMRPENGANISETIPLLYNSQKFNQGSNVDMVYDQCYSFSET